ncbi:MAG: hypothetical protein KA004_19475, partial [Verrucomicrobiales bacterium]|nr:hypothetical protein [Verrucomicrobiales bacterium]
MKMTTPSLSARILAGGPAFLLTAAVCAAQAVFINEIHYDNNSSDTGEGVEIAGPAGTDLSDFDLVFYNGNNPQAAVEYATVRLSGVLPDAANGSGFAWFGPPANGIQNGGNDGVALYRRSTGQVEQLLSYEGVFTASNGVAAGQTSVDIGVAESSTSPAGQSLQLAGAGTLYQQFHWVASQTATPGQINGGQTFGSGGAFSSVLTVAPASVREDADSSAATGTLVLTPAPASPVLISLSSSDVSEVTVPPTVEVPVSGTVAFPLTAVMDGIADGNQPVTVTASDAAGNYPLRQASLVVVDVDELPPPFTGGTIRVATFNVLMGVGAPGSPEFLAVKA